MFIVISSQFQHMGSFGYISYVWTYLATGAYFQ